MDEKLKQQFAKRTKTAICGALREIRKNDVAVLISHRRGQFISKILDVQADNDRFLFDLGGLDEENLRALQADKLMFSAELAGAKIEFNAKIASTVEYDRMPAFCAGLPDEVYYIQRRLFFRINSPAWPPMVCRGGLPDDSRFQFDIKDISLGGVCLYTERKDVGELLNPGDVISDADLDLASYGKFQLDLQFISQATAQVLDGKGDVKQIQRLSFKFVKLTAAQERGLQQAITGLELAQHERRKQVL